MYVQKYAVCFFLAMHMHIDQPAYCIDASDYSDQPTFIRIKLFLNNFRKFFADDLKLLRVAMSSFFDMLIVCAKTLMEFDDSTRSISWAYTLKGAFKCWVQLTACFVLVQNKRDVAFATWMMLSRTMRYTMPPYLTIAIPWFLLWKQEIIKNSNLIWFE